MVSFADTTFISSSGAMQASRVSRIFAGWLGSFQADSKGKQGCHLPDELIGFLQSTRRSAGSFCRFFRSITLKV
jgi:hypothetical protein